MSPDWRNDGVVSDEDVRRAEQLVDRYDEAAADLDFPDDSKVRAAIRDIAEAGSGMPLSSWMPLTMTGYQASDRAWRWIMSCAEFAACGDNCVCAVKLGVFARSWYDLAPDPTPADPVELGLMKPPVDVLATILSQSVLSARHLPADLVVGRFGEQTLTAGFAQKIHAHWLLEHDSVGITIDAEAKAVSLVVART